jgi:hypothetical protein
MYTEVSNALDKCVSDLVGLIKKSEHSFLGEWIESMWSSHRCHYRGESSALSMSQDIGQLMAFNHDWDLGEVFAWTI